eukprot:COSAG02_NODE_4674_length_5106_cov_9.921310_3_plen_84_part_00
MLDKLSQICGRNPAAARAVMDSHPDERRAQEALDLKEVHVQLAWQRGLNGTNSRGDSNSLRQRVARFLEEQVRKRQWSDIWGA